MATLKEVDHTAVSGPNKENPTQEDTEEERTPERRHVEALLDISEEDFMKELEPHEYHCYSGWEEAVHGWGRVAPLSCILLTQRKCGKPKYKEADNPTLLSVDPTTPDAGSSSSASIAEHRCDVGWHHSFKKSTPLNQHVSWSSSAVAALQRDASEWPVLDAMHKTTSNLPLKEKMEGEVTLRETPLQPHYLPSKCSENRATKHQKHRPSNTVVPIRNFTFLPPIKSPHLNPQKVRGQLCSSKKAPEGETIEDTCFRCDKKSRTRGTRADSIVNPELPTNSAALTSKHRTCQHNPHLFSAVSVSIPRRYQVPLSSKPDTVHRTSCSVGKRLTQALHSGSAAGAPAHMFPSKTVCM